MKKIIAILFLFIFNTAYGQPSHQLYKPAWNDTNIGGMSFNLPVANQPGEAQIVDSTGTGTGIYTYGYAIGDGSICVHYEVCFGHIGVFGYHRDKSENR